MSKTLPATPMREPERACRIGASERHDESPALAGPSSSRAHAPRANAAAVRRRSSCPRVTSNLGQPIGVLSWERDFLLGLAVDVLDGFVESTNGQDDHSDGSG